MVVARRQRAPANCTTMAAKPPPPPGHAVATVGYTAHQALQVLDDLTRDRIEEALKKCADEARSTVLLRYSGQFQGVGPTKEECLEWTTDVTGRRVTWAQRLGLEMHEVALSCTAEALARLRPGGFSIEPRFHYDRQTRKKRLISPEEERALVESGNSGELLGSLKPDLVLHAGDPLWIQGVYDFKFSCANTDMIPRWSLYPEGHPYETLDQGRLYKEALGGNPARILPHRGIIR